jgi:hypothetical protein
MATKIFMQQFQISPDPDSKEMFTDPKTIEKYLN